ncbi:hypothetical protein F5883DRAFT_623662 [Diaporthe sp. PMI_573]|nr:hypothetical protein F5883DRAFT_623662 [Diaporthaceae sp. PMI_573]
MAGNSMDKNASISRDMRDLVMDHAPGSDTFQKHYLNRNIHADLWAIHRDQQPQQELPHQAVSHGHSASNRRPTALTQAQVENLKLHPKFQFYTKQLRSPRTPEKNNQIFLKRKSLLARLRKEELRKVRAERSTKQSLEDIERQVRGEDITLADTAASTDHLTPAQQKMFDALRAPLVKSHDAQMQRRSAAIKSLMAYCLEEERCIVKVVPDAQRPPELALQ